MKGDSEKILTAAASALREWYSGSVTLDDCVEHVRAAEPEAASAVLGRALAAGVVVASFGRRTLESRYLEWRAER